MYILVVKGSSGSLLWGQDTIGRMGIREVIWCRTSERTSPASIDRKILIGVTEGAA